MNGESWHKIQVASCASLRTCNDSQCKSGPNHALTSNIAILEMQLKCKLRSAASCYQRTQAAIPTGSIVVTSLPGFSTMTATSLVVAEYCQDAMAMYCQGLGLAAAM